MTVKLKSIFHCIDSFTIHSHLAQVNTQQRFLEAKQEESLRKCQPRKWRRDIEAKMSEDRLRKKVHARTKDFGPGESFPCAHRGVCVCMCVCVCVCVFICEQLEGTKCFCAFFPF